MLDKQQERTQKIKVMYLLSEKIQSLTSLYEKFEELMLESRVMQCTINDKKLKLYHELKEENIDISEFQNSEPKMNLMNLMMNSITLGCTLHVCKEPPTKWSIMASELSIVEESTGYTLYYLEKDSIISIYKKKEDVPQETIKKLPVKGSSSSNALLIEEVVSIYRATYRMWCTRQEMLSRLGKELERIKTDFDLLCDEINITKEEIKKVTECKLKFKSNFEFFKSYTGRIDSQPSNRSIQSDNNNNLATIPTYKDVFEHQIIGFIFSTKKCKVCEETIHLLTKISNSIKQALTSNDTQEDKESVLLFVIKQLQQVMQLKGIHEDIFSNLEMCFQSWRILYVLKNQEGENIGLLPLNATKIINEIQKSPAQMLIDFLDFLPERFSNLEKLYCAPEGSDINCNTLKK